MSPRLSPFKQSTTLPYCRVGEHLRVGLQANPSSRHIRGPEPGSSLHLEVENANFVIGTPREDHLLAVCQDSQTLSLVTCICEQGGSFPFVHPPNQRFAILTAILYDEDCLSGKPDWGSSMILFALRVCHRTERSVNFEHGKRDARFLTPSLGRRGAGLELKPLQGATGQQALSLAHSRCLLLFLSSRAHLLHTLQLRSIEFPFLPATPPKPDYSRRKRAPTMFP